MSDYEDNINFDLIKADHPCKGCGGLADVVALTIPLAHPDKIIMAFTCRLCWPPCSYSKGMDRAEFAEVYLIK